MVLKAVNQSGAEPESVPRRRRMPQLGVSALLASALLAVILSGWMIHFCWYKSGFNPDPVHGQAVLARHMYYLIIYLGGQMLLLTLSRVKELSTVAILANAGMSFVPVVIGAIAVVNHFQGIIQLTWYMPTLVGIWMLAAMVDTVVSLAYAFNLKGRLFGGFPVET